MCVIDFAANGFAVCGTCEDEYGVGVGHGVLLDDQSLRQQILRGKGLHQIKRQATAAFH